MNQLLFLCDFIMSSRPYIAPLSPRTDVIAKAAQISATRLRLMGPGGRSGSIKITSIFNTCYEYARDMSTYTITLVPEVDQGSSADQRLACMCNKYMF